MLEQQRHIDLHLPTGWNQCTTEELEHIAAAIILCQQRQDRYHPFDWAQVKLMAVLGINHLEVVTEGTEKTEDTEKRRKATTALNGSAADESWLVKREQDDAPFLITTGQLADLCTRLDWLTEEKPRSPLFQFPYPEIKVQGSGFKVQGGSKLSTLNSQLSTIVGPPPLLDGYSWQEYRWLTDWMQEYLRIGNAIAQGNSEKRIVNNLLPQQMQARNEFLAVLFKPAGKPMGTGTADHTSAISHLTSDIFTDFSPVKWQVILFWWSALMLQLERKFPKVFKQQPVGKQRRQQKDTPWDFYNRVIATIQKYVGGLSEKDVNQASYGTILQQLDMMAREAEEMEKLNKKYKHK